MCRCCPHCCAPTLPGMICILPLQVLVIEAALTGEPFPVVKVPALDDGGRLAADLSRSRLAAGTTVLQTRCMGGAPILARVWATSFW